MLARDVPAVPALYFELASIERGPEFGLPQRVIDGHRETLDGGIESCQRILKAGGRLIEAAAAIGIEAAWTADRTAVGGLCLDNLDVRLGQLIDEP